MKTIGKYEIHFKNSVTQRDIENWSNTYEENLELDKNGNITPYSEKKAINEKARMLCRITVDIINVKNDNGDMGQVPFTNDFLLDLNPHDFLEIFTACDQHLASILEKKN